MSISSTSTDLYSLLLGAARVLYDRSYPALFHAVTHAAAEIKLRAEGHGMARQTVDRDNQLSEAQRVLRDGYHDDLSEAIAEARNLMNGLPAVPPAGPGIRQGAVLPHEVLYFRSMGKALRVTAIFTDTEAANEYMATHRDDAMIAAVGGIIYLANRHDQGATIG